MGTKPVIPPPPLVCRTKQFDFSMRSYLMGVVNITPDSFSDGGCYFSRGKAVAHGIELAEQGADMLDIGGESTRPGATPVACDEEVQRVTGVIADLAKRVRIPISIDTTKAEVARRALDAGAEIINDVSALRFDPDMVRTAAHYQVPVILMHMPGTWGTMHNRVSYTDLMKEILSFLSERIACACRNGIAENNIIVDPGIGFGKAVTRDNVTILHRLGDLQELGRPILVGPSRKAFIGKLLDAEVMEREYGTAATVAVAVCNGAHIVRVHNVKAMRMAARIADAVIRA